VPTPGLLVCTRVTKSYGGLTAVSGVDLSVAPGTLLAIVGPNGAGKTTLFDVISGVTPATSGTVHLDGRLISTRRPQEICRLGLARTFQTAVAFASQSVLRNVLVGSLFGRRGSPVLPFRASAEAVRAAREALRVCGLAGAEGTEAASLSVLDRKRLMLASALACNPRVLLLDEPFGGLNPGERDELRSLIRRLHSAGTTIVMIEHIVKLVQALADRVLVLHHGERLAEGTPAEVFGDPRVIEVYLGSRARAAMTADEARTCCA
jgi:branched-chain amino acid transport system ATP-binding protein